MDDEISVKDVTDYIIDEVTLEGAIVQDLVNEVGYMQKDESSLERCVECQSIFEIRREGQQFCSRRCSSRAGERRRYKSRRAAPAEVK